VRNYQKSLEWYERAKLWTCDASQTMSKSPRRYPVGAHPLALARGNGCHVEDLDGNEFIDWSLGLAAVTLGYNYPFIDEQIQLQLMDGISFSLPHWLEAEVAEKVCGVFPCANNGSVRFVKTGSEADSAACRIARRATGRDVILACGYLGWHDWAMSRAKEHPGIPEFHNKGTYSFEFGDRFWLSPWDKTNGLGFEWDDVAAIFIEPPLFLPEKLDVKAYLESLKTLAHEHGALLIFDEVVYGSRFALGGGQEFYGVTPDLCTWGKGLANGMPLAGIAGPREIMKYSDVISGTFGGETLSLAACNATLDVYQHEPVIGYLWYIGTKFCEGLQRQIKDYGLPAKIEGFAVHPRLKWDCFDKGLSALSEKQANLLMSLWLQEMAEGGVLVHPGGWNCSYSHTNQDVQDSLAASDKAFAVCAEALRSGDIKKYLRGAPIEQGFKVR
jgi:glutamate-1-semialdehyde 2,1-aminomutase